MDRNQQANSSCIRLRSVRYVADMAEKARAQIYFTARVVEPLFTFINPPPLEASLPEAILQDVLIPLAEDVTLFHCANC